MMYTIERRGDALFILQDTDSGVIEHFQDTVLVPDGHGGARRLTDRERLLELVGMMHRRRLIDDEGRDHLHKAIKEFISPSALS